MGLVTIHDSCLVKYLFISFAHFTIRLLVWALFCFFLSRSENSLYITDTRSLSVMWFANIFSQLVAYLFRVFCSTKQDRICMLKITCWANKSKKIWIMERYIVLLDWKTQYHKDVHFPPNWSIDSTQFISKSQPKKFFVAVDNLILKFIWNGKGTRVAKTIFKRKN